MITILVGLEKYKKEKEIQKLVSDREVIRYESFDRRCLDELEENSLFGRKTVLVEQAALENSKELFKYLDSPGGTNLIISIDSFGRGKKLAIKLQEKGRVIQCKKLREEELERYLLGAIKVLSKRKGTYFKRECTLRITRDALALFIERSGYLEEDQVSLCELNLHLKQLVFFDQDDITTDLVESLIPAKEKDDSRDLQRAIFRKDAKTAMEIANQISSKGSEIIGVLGLLLRSFRIGWKAKKLNIPEKETMRALGLNDWAWRTVAPVTEYSIAVIEKAIAGLENAMEDIKAGRGGSRDVFLLAVGEILGGIKNA